jgi:hypothetical protein
MKTKLSLTLFVVLVLAAAAHAQFTYTTNNGTITIWGFTGTNSDVVIPSTIDGLPVTTIGHNAFDQSNLTSLIMPNSLISIGDVAFWGAATA